MTRRILCELQLLRLGSATLALLIFTGCATLERPSARRAQRDSTISAERLRKIRHRQAQLEDLHERQLVLGNVRKSQTVRVKHRDVRSVRADRESRWAVPPGVERRQLEVSAGESADALLFSESPAPVVGSGELAAFDHIKANQKLQRELPGKLAPQQPPSQDRAAIEPLAEPVVEAKPVETEQAEHILYAGVMRAFKRRDQTALAQSVNLFMKTYPMSIYADNALYLEAMLYIEKQDYAKAERVIAEIIRNYPNGNKTVSALFARAAIYRETKQWKKARSLLEEIKNNYPGSLESQRVPLEVRMIASLEKKGQQR